MKIVLQKVSSAHVRVDNVVISSINHGYVLFLGVINGDTLKQADWLVAKVCNLRLFTSNEGKINDLSIKDVNGSVLVVSQFTLAANIQNGNRPEYISAMNPKEAEVLYTYFVQKLESSGIVVHTGQFGAHMYVALENDGPVTLLLERNLE